MFDMNLIQGQPALKVDFSISLPGILLNTMMYLTHAPEIEGFDAWIYTTHAALDPALLNDIKVIIPLVVKSPAFNEYLLKLPPDNPVLQDFSAFIAWLSAFSEQEIHEMLIGSLRHFPECCEDEETSELSDEMLEEIHKHLSEKLDKATADQMIHYVRTPLEFKAQFISMLTRFWEQFYRQEYQRCLPLAERSVAYHRRQTYGNDVATIFTTVTGRRVPDEMDNLDKVAHVVFIPSCYLGPYVSVYITEGEERSMILHYNCRPSSALKEESAQAPRIQDIFPPLKALSDETRLQILSILNGKELYAQEIVDQLDISQSAVSRHLKLMLSSGVLSMRKEESMKYFSINEETLKALATRLQGFKGKESQA